MDLYAENYRPEIRRNFWRILAGCCVASPPPEEVLSDGWSINRWSTVRPADAERLEVPLVAVVYQAGCERTPSMQPYKVGTGWPGGDVVEIRPCRSSWTNSTGKDWCRTYRGCCDHVDAPIRKQLMIGGVQNVKVAGER